MFTLFDTNVDRVMPAVLIDARKKTYGYVYVYIDRIVHENSQSIQVS